MQKILHKKHSLHYPLKIGGKENVKELLEKNINIDDHDDCTTLFYHFAAIGEEETCKLLLKKGADVNAKLENSLTALHVATQRCYKEVVEILLEFGAEVDCKNNNGDTPLHFSAQNKNIEICKLLLNKGACVNAKNDYEGTALLYAIQRRHKELVKILLEFGAEIDCKYRNNNVPGELRKVIDCHIIKRKTANLFVSENNRLLFRDTLIGSDFEEKCKEEILCLKNEKINNTNISFFDILTRDCLLAMYMKNENIVQVLKGMDYERKFPIYGNLVKINFMKGMKRRELLDKCYKFFPLLCNNFTESPQCYTEKILNYLNDKDLSVLIKAFQPDK